MSDLDTQTELDDTDSHGWRVPDVGMLLVLAVFVICGAMLLGLYASQRGMRHVRAFGGEVDCAWGPVADIVTDFVDIDPRLLSTDADAHTVWLDGAAVTDASTTVLRRFPSIEDLYITNANVTDDGLDQLSVATELRCLQIYDSPQITDAGIANLARLPNLRWLDLEGMPVTGDGIAALGQIETLYLDRCPRVDNSTLEHVGGLSNLTDLSVADSRVTDAGLRHLAGLRRLTSLTLDQTRITDAGLATIIELFPDLNYLSLDEVRGITDAGVLKLAALKSLTTLYLQSTDISDEAVASLSQALPRCDVIHSRSGR